MFYSLARDEPNDQCVLPLREKFLVEVSKVGGGESPTEQIGFPGELGQVNFLFSPESSPAGKLGTAQEPFLKTKSHN